MGFKDTLGFLHGQDSIELIHCRNGGINKKKEGKKKKNYYMHHQISPFFHCGFYPIP
jgi:hypothetical protein